MADAPMSPKRDLAIKESILGVLRAKDKSGTGTIHVTEFDQVVAAFGLSWDTPAVKNVLGHCKMDSGDRLDYSSLKGVLESEKKRLTARPVLRTKAAVIATPKASGVIKEQQEYIRERQQRAVQENVSHITTVYKMLARHDIDKRTAISLLQQHQIYPTKELVKVAAEMETGEVSFAEFRQALTASDPYPRAAAVTQAQTTMVYAGSIRPPPVDQFVPEEVVPGKKQFAIPPSQVAVVPDDELVLMPPKPARRPVEEARGKAAVMGALFNETGASLLGSPEDVDWSASPSGKRHHVVEGRRGVLARAQLHHGDCVTWSTEPSPLEALHAELARPVGRKLDDSMLVANHLTNVISWDGFKGHDSIDEQEVVRRELGMVGGVSVSSGLRNAASDSNILAWEEPSPVRRRPAGSSKGSSKSSRSGAGTPTTPPAASAAVLNIGEYTRYTPPNAVRTSPSLDSPVGGQAWAGSPSLRPERAQLRKSASFSRFYNASAPPFGTDEPSPNGAPCSPSSFYNRGRTSTGGRFPIPDRDSPVALDFAGGAGVSAR